MLDGVVFPGQGSQRPGMGLDFAARFPSAKRTFDEASEALGEDVAALCADEMRLGLTEHAQPCILAVEIAIFRTLQAEHGFAPERFGGHSLGEYSALVAAGAIPFAAALRLVRLRGQEMQRASPVGAGGMLAVLQPELDRALMARAAQESDVDVANDNSPSQMVLSGAKAGLQAARAALEPVLALASGRTVELEVSAPFHSRGMRPAEPQLRAALDAESPSFAPAKASRVASNFLGGFHLGTAASLIDALVSQVSGQVRWQENMRALTAEPVRLFELGPGKPLTRFFAELGHKVRPVIQARAVEKALAAE